MTDRRKFIKSTSMAGLGMGLLGALPVMGKKKPYSEIGVIGLDTSHSIAFTKIINDPANKEFSDFKVTAAYPYGSRTIEANLSRIPGYTEEIKKLGIEILDSMDDLLKRVDCVMLLTHDGNAHLEQANKVLATGKRTFINKPFAGNLKDALEIAHLSIKYKNPTWSGSSLRFVSGVQEAKNIKGIGTITGADTYGPANLEPSHTDLNWYGMHGVETLFTIMGIGCKEVTRIFTAETDLVVGKWNDDRIGTFRGIRNGYRGDGGTVYGSEGVYPFKSGGSYKPMLVELAKFFRTGIVPVNMKETLEIYAFMEAADESKKAGGIPIDLKPFLTTINKLKF